jgi:fatty-acyl-CoA synthase
MLARLKSELAYARGLLSGVARTRVVGAAPTKTLGDYFEEWSLRHGDRPALGSDGESFSYRQLDARANRYARWARGRGLGKGDVVALMMMNRPEYLAIWLGFARAGAATALINTNLTGQSLAHCISAVKAKAAVVESRLMPAFATARPELEAGLAVYCHGVAATGDARIDIEVEALPDASLGPGERPSLTTGDAALFIYTSGTTGLPKAARITHGRVLRIMLGFSGAAGARASDRMYNCLPMYHTNGGLLAPGMALAAGASCWIRERFSASAFWSDVIAQKCTTFIYIGEMCRFLVNTPPSAGDRAHEIRFCLGNGLRPDIFATFQQRFGIPRVIEFYGATEGNTALFNLDSHPGSVGRMPFWAAKRFPIKIVAYDVETNTQKHDGQGHCIECAADEAGELIAEILDDPKLPAARFDGYADPAATKAKVLRDVFKPGDAWFRTGDLLQRDALGYYYFVDRIGDTYRWKGENVSTTEVAETIDGFAGVREAIVYGVAVSGHDGRAGMAALVVENVATFDLNGLRVHLAERLPAYARPLFVRFRTDLEMTSTFKPKKTQLVAEGFDPARTAEPVFFDDRGAGAYRPVDAALLDGLEAGTVRL